MFLGDKPLGSIRFCKYYILGKKTRVKFSKDIHTSKHNLEYIHSNLSQSRYWACKVNLVDECDKDNIVT